MTGNNRHDQRIESTFCPVYFLVPTLFSWRSSNRWQWRCCASCCQLRHETKTILNQYAVIIHQRLDHHSLHCSCCFNSLSFGLVSFLDNAFHVHTAVLTLVQACCHRKTPNVQYWSSSSIQCEWTVLAWIATHQILRTNNLGTRKLTARICHTWLANWFALPVFELSRMKQWHSAIVTLREDHVHFATAISSHCTLCSSPQRRYSKVCVVLWTWAIAQDLFVALVLQLSNPLRQAFMFCTNTYFQLNLSGFPDLDSQITFATIRLVWPWRHPLYLFVVSTPSTVWFVSNCVVELALSAHVFALFRATLVWANCTRILLQSNLSTLKWFTRAMTQHSRSACRDTWIHVRSHTWTNLRTDTRRHTWTWSHIRSDSRRDTRRSSSTQSLSSWSNSWSNFSLLRFDSMPKSMSMLASNSFTRASILRSFSRWLSQSPFLVPVSVPPTVPPTLLPAVLVELGLAQRHHAPWLTSPLIRYQCVEIEPISDIAMTMMKIVSCLDSVGLWQPDSINEVSLTCTTTDQHLCNAKMCINNLHMRTLWICKNLNTRKHAK